MSGAGLRPLVAYLVRAALGERLFAGLLGALLLSAALAAFLGSTVLVEQREFAAVLTASAARLAVVLALVLFTCFHIRRAFDSREVDLLLSRPVSRADFVLAHALMLILCAALLAALAGLTVAVIARPAPAAWGWWTLSVFLEATIVALAALFFALALRSGVTSALACLGLYLLGRDDRAARRHRRGAQRRRPARAGARPSGRPARPAPAAARSARPQRLAGAWGRRSGRAARRPAPGRALRRAARGRGELRLRPPAAVKGHAARRPGALLLLVALAGHAALALHHRGLQAGWPGVPSAPPAMLAPLLTLGDAQLFYRSAGFGLQNLGDGGGRTTPLRNYDYGRLEAWLQLLDRLDPQADYVPTLAGLYFGQTPEPADLRRIVHYLTALGARDPARHWRWLAHAVYLARHRLHDRPLALAIARHLAGLAGAAAPLWVRQMPAFALAEVGEREAARDLLETILATEPDLAAGEVALMRDLIDRRLADPES